MGFGQHLDNEKSYLAGRLLRCLSHNLYQFFYLYGVFLNRGRALLSWELILLYQRQVLILLGNCTILPCILENIISSTFV